MFRVLIICYELLQLIAQNLWQWAGMATSETCFWCKVTQSDLVTWHEMTWILDLQIVKGCNEQVRKFQKPASRRFSDIYENPEGITRPARRGLKSSDDAQQVFYCSTAPLYSPGFPRPLPVPCVVPDSAEATVCTGPLPDGCLDVQLWRAVALEATPGRRHL